MQQELIHLNQLQLQNYDLVSLKAEVDKIDIAKLVPVAVDLSKLSDGVKDDVVKKPVYEKLVERINNSDTRGFVLKSTYSFIPQSQEKTQSGNLGRTSVISFVLRRLC